MPRILNDSFSAKDLNLPFIEVESCLTSIDQAIADKKLRRARRREKLNLLFYSHHPNLYNVHNQHRSNNLQISLPHEPNHLRGNDSVKNL